MFFFMCEITSRHLSVIEQTAVENKLNKYKGEPKSLKREN